MCELCRKSLLVILECLLPVTLIDYDTLSDLLRVQQKLAQADYGNRQLVRTADSLSPAVVAVSSLVQTLDQVTSLLKFNREEE